MSIVKLTAEDGYIVEFEDHDGSPPKQGGIKDVYFTTDKKYAVAFYRKKLDSVAEERLERIVNRYRKNIFEQVGGNYWKEIFCWPERVVKEGTKTGILVPFYDKKFFFGPSNGGDDFLEGSEKEGKWFTSAKNFNLFVPVNQKGDLQGYLSVCQQLSRGVKKLHMSGLAHSDLSYKNCLVDPVTGSACIIDIDGLVVPGLFPPDVIGTKDFIAPEVVATAHLKDDQRKLPCQDTDLHALSVLIYEYLFHRHPLEGDKVHDQDPEIQLLLEMGEKALFIENPFDTSNRKTVKSDDGDFLPWIDTNKLPYVITGPYLKELFDKAFIKGLHNPYERPTADDWDVAISRTKDLLLPCSNKKCSMKWFIYDRKSAPVCPYCGTTYNESLPILDFYSTKSGDKYVLENRQLIVYNNLNLYLWHVYKNIFPNETLEDKFKKPVGHFSFQKNKWYFVNQTLGSMRDITDTNNPIMIPINGKVEISYGKTLKFADENTSRIAYIRLTNTPHS
ncbi:MAG: kinase [Deltaproteobacteria bacterium]|jgi:serine/threonine protein kinase|nr:kinase [Deltaproteobacteria bacterium]